MSLESLTESLSRLPVVGLIVRAFLKSWHDHTKDLAASIAYFSFFSLFPLFLGVVAAGSFFMDSVAFQNRLDRVMADTLPGSADFVKRNVNALIQLRGAAGLTSIAGLFWSASKMFGAVSRAINRALELPRPHPSYLSRLRSLVLTLTVALLLFLSTTVPTGLGFVLYLENVSRLEAVYGSLSSIIVLLLWLYFSAFVLLLGADLIAVRRQRDHENSTAT